MKLQFNDHLFVRKSIFEENFECKNTILDTDKMAKILRYVSMLVVLTSLDNAVLRRRTGYEE